MQKPKQSATRDRIGIAEIIARLEAIDVGEDREAASSIRLASLVLSIFDVLSSRIAKAESDEEVSRIVRVLVAGGHMP